MKILKIGTFDDRGMPTGWQFDLNLNAAQVMNVEYVLGIDVLFSGSVDVNGCEIVEWTKARRELTTEPVIKLVIEPKFTPIKKEIVYRLFRPIRE